MTTNLNLVNWRPVTFTEKTDTNVLTKEEKIDKEKVFSLGQKIVTVVESGKNRGTGFFIELFSKKLFVTTAHTIEPKQSIFVAECDQGFVVDSLASDVCLIDVFTQNDHEVSHLPSVEGSYQVTVGTKVYVVGYPLGQNAPIFHMGKISSIVRDKFSIDGTILPGHSGSPVLVVMSDGNLRVLGMVTSQALSSKRKFEEFCENPDTQKIAEVYGSNLTTGIGWAIDIRKIQESKIEVQNDYEIATTGIKVEAVSGQLNIKGIEKSFGKNRGIMTSIEGTPNSNVEWQISPNPHNSHLYNKNQKDFYKKAIDTYALAYANNGNANPTSFQFDFDSIIFTAAPR